MATTSPTKLIRTEANMFSLVESWLRSNRTQKEFSLKHQLSPHMLPYWINRYRHQKGQTETPPLLTPLPRMLLKKHLPALSNYHLQSVS